MASIRNFRDVVIAAAFNGRKAGEEALAELTRIDSEAKGEFAEISGFVLQVADALAITPRLVKLDDDGVHIEPWDRLAMRYVEAILASDEHRARVLEFVNDISSFGVLHGSTVQKMLAREREDRAARRAAQEAPKANVA